jgi:hypothetical protein
MVTMILVNKPVVLKQMMRKKYDDDDNDDDDEDGDERILNQSKIDRLIT